MAAPARRRRRPARPPEAASSRRRPARASGAGPARPRRRPGTPATRRVVERFNTTFNRHDVEAVMALSTEDTVVETTLPRPDGRRLVGQAAVRRYWERFFRDTPTARFEAEELLAVGDRCLVRWRFTWAADRRGRPGHVRGIDVFRVRAGKVAEKLVYVKG
jgi:ketosteroid isomerase-like protein